MNVVFAIRIAVTVRCFLVASEGWNESLRPPACSTTKFVQAVNITVVLRCSTTAIVCAYHAVNNSTVFYVLFQGSELCYWHISYIVLLGEDQNVVCHLLWLKSKYLRCLPQTIFIACKLIIVSEFGERFSYSGGRSLLIIKKDECCAEWHILLCRVSATRFGTLTRCM
jgi:hypothetical protein